MYGRVFVSKLNPGNVEAIYNLGHVSELEGDYHGAVQQYKKAIEVDPQAISPRFLLALLYDRHDMFDEAIQEYQGVLEKNPSHIKALFNLGNLYVQLGDYKKAIGLFERILTSDPHNAEAWNNMGAIYDITEQYEEALNAYQKSLALNPYHEEANVNLAQIQYKKYRLNPDSVKRDEIILRLTFVLSINPQQKRAQNILQELTKGNL